MIEISIQFMCLRIVSTLLAYVHVHTCAQVLFPSNQSV